MKNKLLSIVVAVAMMVSCVCEASAAFVNDTIIDGSPTSGEGRIDNVLPDEELLNNDSTFTFSELSDSKKYYSVTPDDPEWENFSTSKEMIEACAIPASQLEKMSTYELADAVLAFPLLMDIYFFNDIDMALKNLSKRSDAYSALLQREDAMEVMESVYKTMQSSRDTDELMLHTMELLLSDERVIVNQEITGSHNCHLAKSTKTIYTPNGSPVTVVIRSENSSEFNRQLDEHTKKTYPNATYVAPSTSTYNCHNFAWNTDSPRQYWMNDPTAYMTDGSYKEGKISSTKQAKVYYEFGNHSGNYVPQESLAYKPLIASKWGPGPLMLHTYDYCPYDASSVSFWLR